MNNTVSQPSSRAIALKLFLTCWLIYALHFATNTVREIYPALALGDHFSFDVTEYLGLHPDLFEMPGRGAFINNNPGASIFGAVPYALARPVIDRAVERVQAMRAASNTPPPDYATIYPMSREFYRQAYIRGLDVKFALGAGVMQAFLMAPLSALSVVVMFYILLSLTGSTRRALWLAILYAFATPIFYRTAQLNQNLLISHMALFAFALLWHPWNASARAHYFFAGLFAGWAVVLDYSGLVVVAAMSVYALVVWRDTPRAARSLFDLAQFAIGVAASGSVLMAYQWASFGNLILPAQRYMPATEFSGYGFSGMVLPQLDLLWDTAFGFRFGLFISAPILLLTFAAPLWLRREARLIANRETWFVILFTLAFFLFSSASQYGRLQFNSGVRYIVPVTPFLFLIVAGALLQLPARFAIILGIIGTYWSWCLAMYRDVEQGWGVFESLIHITTEGVRLPWLMTFERLGYIQNGILWSAGVLVLSGAFIWGLWQVKLVEKMRYSKLAFGRVAQFILAAIALGIFVWAILDPRFRSSEGFFTGAFCFPVSVSGALLILAITHGSSIRHFGFWFALALVGQAAALQMIDAGNLLRYQHYKPPLRLLTETSPALVLLLVAQTILVFAGFKNRLAPVRAWVAAHLRVWQVVGIGLIFTLSSAAVQREILYYFTDLVLAIFVQTINLANIALMVWALPENVLTLFHQKFEKVFEPTARHGQRIDRLALVAASWVVILAASLSFLSYAWHPHITDEVVYLYQARFLAAGAVALPAPPVPEAFEIYLMQFKGATWFPVTPPGWPAVLALGVALGIPGLVNPILGGLNVLLVFHLLQELYDRRIARLSALLLAVSPWYVFMAMNFMTHMLTLTCALVAAVGIIHARKTNNAAWSLLAGAGIGLASLIRPLEGLIVGGLIGLWAIGIGGRRVKFASLVTFALGTILIASIVLPFNQILAGTPTIFPINAYMDARFGPGKNDLGFGPNRGYGWPIQPFPGHSPLGGVVNANLNIFSINIELFGWGIGSLLFVALILVSKTLHKSDYLMLAVCSAIFVPYFFYYFSGGPDFGARYWFLMLVPLVALSARGIFWLQEKLAAGATSSPGNGTRVLVAVLSLMLIALINYFPWRALDKYYNFWGMRPDVVRLNQEYKFGKSLVLIRAAESHPDFASAAIYNPLDWNDDAPVYAWDRNPTVRTQLLKAFPDRRVWLVDAPSYTHTGYQVVGGPFSAQELESPR